VKIVQGIQGVYIRKLGKISVKLSVVGVLHLAVAPMGVKFGTDEGTFAKFHPFGPCVVKNLKIAE